MTTADENLELDAIEIPGAALRTAPLTPPRASQPKKTEPLPRRVRIREGLRRWLGVTDVEKRTFQTAYNLGQLDAARAQLIEGLRRDLDAIATAQRELTPASVAMNTIANLNRAIEQLNRNTAAIQALDTLQARLNFYESNSPDLRRLRRLFDDRENRRLKAAEAASNSQAEAPPPDVPADAALTPDSAAVTADPPPEPPSPNPLE